jgi:hypothetical protein
VMVAPPQLPAVDGAELSEELRRRSPEGAEPSGEMLARKKMGGGHVIGRPKIIKKAYWK